MNIQNLEGSDKKKRTVYRINNKGLSLVEDEEEVPGQHPRKRSQIKLGSMNWICLTKDHKVVNLLDGKKSTKEHFALMPEIITSEPTKISNNKITCHCKRSKCLKLYCECFSKGIKCSK